MKLAPADLPATLVAATLAAEDRRFWSHPGVDPIAVLRALKINLAERSVVEGGSTISQQVAKLLLNRRDPDRRRGWTAKLHEAVIALRLEHRFDKREILAMYLNLAGYGNQIAGAERASRAYFGTSAALLTPAQAAFLAGLPQRPSGFNPYRSRTAAVSRQRVVLRRMQAGGALDRRTAPRWRGTSGSRFRPATLTVRRAALCRDGAGARRPNAPERIETTLDASLQTQIAGNHRQSSAGRFGEHGAAQRRRGRARQPRPANGWRGKAPATIVDAARRRHHQRRGHRRVSQARR